MRGLRTSFLVQACTIFVYSTIYSSASLNDFLAEASGTIIFTTVISPFTSQVILLILWGVVGL